MFIFFIIIFLSSRTQLIDDISSDQQSNNKLPSQTNDFWKQHPHHHYRQRVQEFDMLLDKQIYLSMLQNKVRSLDQEEALFYEDLECTEDINFASDINLEHKIKCRKIIRSRKELKMDLNDTPYIDQNCKVQLSENSCQYCSFGYIPDGFLMYCSQISDFNIKFMSSGKFLRIENIKKSRLLGSKFEPIFGEQNLKFMSNENGLMFLDFSFRLAINVKDEQIYMEELLFIIESGSAYFEAIFVKERFFYIRHVETKLYLVDFDRLSKVPELVEVSYENSQNKSEEMYFSEE